MDCAGVTRSNCRLKTFVNRDEQGFIRRREGYICQVRYGRVDETLCEIKGVTERLLLVHISSCWALFS